MSAENSKPAATEEKNIPQYPPMCMMLGHTAPIRKEDEHREKDK